MPAATTHGERTVLEHASSGELVDLSELPEGERIIDADVVRRLLLETEKADPRGFRIKGASIQGELDLAFCRLERPLAFVETEFSESLRLAQCSLPHLSLWDCRLPGLEAEELRVEFDVDLHGVEAGGPVVLTGARIAGRLILDGATLSSDRPVSLVGDGAAIGGDLLLRDGFSATGAVVLLGARVGGNLEGDGATLSNEGGWALVAAGAQFGGGVLLRNGFSATGGVLLHGAKLGGNLECDGATLNNEDGWALLGVGAQIDGGALFRNGFRATGGVGLIGAKVGRDLDCDGATLSNESGWALVANGAEIAGFVLLRGFTATGGVDLAGAKVSRNLECDGATLTNERDWALTAEAAEIGGGAAMRNGFRAAGGVLLLGARVGSNLDFDRATLVNEDGWALVADSAQVGGAAFFRNGFSATGGVRLIGIEVGRNLECDGASLNAGGGGWALVVEGADIGGDVFLRDGFSATGVVRLFGAKLRGNLECEGATLTHESGWALDADGADVAGTFVFSEVKVVGGLKLFKLRCATLIDDLGPPSGLGSWAGAKGLMLAGFSYDRFGGDQAAWDADARFRWLRKTMSFDAGSWQRLIEVYRAHGEDEKARRTAIAMENDRLERGGLSPLRRVGRWILRVTIGHGYRSWLALVWAVAIVVPFALLVWAAPADVFVPRTQGTAASPQPLVYSLDTFLPIVNLGEADQWTVTGALQWATWTVILLGWALSTIFVAGFTRVVRNV